MATFLEDSVKNIQQTVQNAKAAAAAQKAQQDGQKVTAALKAAQNAQSAGAQNWEALDALLGIGQSRGASKQSSKGPSSHSSTSRSGQQRTKVNAGAQTSEPQTVTERQKELLDTVLGVRERGGLTLGQWDGTGRTTASLTNRNLTGTRETSEAKQWGGEPTPGGSGESTASSAVQKGPTAHSKSSRSSTPKNEEVKTFTNWTGRDELIRQLEEIDNNSGYITDPALANATEKRRNEILRRLEAGDEAAGNGIQNYGDADRARKIFGGATKDYLSGVTNRAGTDLTALYEGVNTNPYAGWATDELSAGEIKPERDEEELEQFSFLKTGGEKLEQTADRLGESAARDLESAKAGLGTMGQAGVDIATNLIQMGYDAATGSGLFSMYLRSAGAAAREARLQGASTSQQFWYGAAKGGIEAGTEMLGNGVSSVLSKIYGKGLADDITEEVIRKLVSSDTGRTFARFIAGSMGEGVEEAISDLLSPVAETIYKGMPKNGEGLYQNFDVGGMIYDFLIGTAIGSLGSVTGIATGENRAANERLREMDTAEVARHRGLTLGEVENEAAQTADNSARTEAERARAAERSRMANSNTAAAIAQQRGEAEADRARAAERSRMANRNTAAEIAQQRGEAAAQDRLAREEMLREAGLLKEGEYLGESVTVEEEPGTESLEAAAPAPMGGEGADAVTGIPGKAAAIEESTSVNTDPAVHTEAEQKAIKEYQDAVNEDVKNAVQAHFDGSAKDFTRQAINSVSERQAKDARGILGGEYDGYVNAINSNGITHILEEHGPNGSVDHSLADLNDIARIGYILNNYDTVERTTYKSGDPKYSAEFRDKHNRPAPTLLYSKKVNGTYYVVEAVPDSAYKKFWVVSAYMEANKNEGLTKASNVGQSTNPAPDGTPEASLPSQPSIENASGDTKSGVTVQDGLTRGPEVPSADNVTQEQGNGNNNLGGNRNETVEQGTAETEQGLLGQAETQPATREDGLRVGEADTVGGNPAAGTEITVTAGEAPADGSRGRNAGGRAGGETGRLDSGTGGRAAGTEREGRNAAGQSLGNAVRRSGREAVSTREFFGFGTERRSFIPLTDQELTDELREIAYGIMMSTGCTTRFIAGPMEITGADGRTYRLPAYIDFRNGEIVIQVDHGRYTAEQLADHEKFHALARKDEGLVAAIRDRIIRRFSREDLSRIARSYIIHRRGVDSFESFTDVTDEAALRVLEEIFADANARMNVFGAGANRYAFDTWTEKRNREDYQRDVSGSRETRGPPEERKFFVDKKGNVVVDGSVTQETVRTTLQEILDGKHKKTGFTFPILKNTPQVFMDYCHLDGDRSFVMWSGKAYQAMQENVQSQHALGVDGLMQVIEKLYTPDYIVYQNEGPNAGHYVAIVTINEGETIAAVDLGDYRSGNNSINREDGYYNVLITAFKPDSDYIDNNILIDGNDIVYDSNVDKQYEAPEHVASGESPSGLASGASTKVSITQGEEENKRKFSITEEDDGNEWYQLSMDDISNGEMSRSTLHPAIRARAERAAQLTEDVKDAFHDIDPESELWLSDEEIEDLMTHVTYGSDPDTGDIPEIDEITQRLSELSESQTGEERLKTYELMDRTLSHMGTQLTTGWIGTGNEDTVQNQDFAAWYHNRHPSLYYRGYQPGDLFKNRRNVQREIHHLDRLLEGNRLTEEDREQARLLRDGLEYTAKYNDMTGAWPKGDIYYSVVEEDTETTQGEGDTGSQEEMPEDPRDRTIRELRETNRQLEQYAEYWKKQGRITGEGEEKARRSDVQRITKELAEHADFQGDVPALQQKVQELGDMIVSNNNGSGLNWEDIREKAGEIATELVENSYSTIDPEADTRKAVLGRLKELKIRPDPMWTGDIGDWDGFRRKQIGKLVFSKEGQNIDDVYQTLRGEFGEGLFPESVTAGSDQIQRILETLDSLRPQQAYNFADPAEAELAEQYYTNRITDELLFGKLGPELTRADRNYQRVKERMVKAEREVREIRQESRRKLDELQRMQRHEVRAALENQRKGVKDREEKQKVRKRIDKTGKRLIKYLSENNGKNPIPLPLQDSIGKVLLDLDLSGGMEKKQKERYLRDMQEIARIVTRQNAYLEGKTDAWAGMYLDLPADVLEELNEHLDNVQRAMDEAEARGEVWNPNMMNLEELNRLDEILTVLSSAVTNANELLSDARGAKVDEKAAQGIREVDSLGADRNRGGKREAVNRFLRFQNTTPYYFFKRLGKAGQEIFELIQDGWDKFAMNARQVVDFANDIYTAKEAKEIQNDVYEFQLRRRGDMSAGFDKPETVSMTKAQIMSLYCLWKRQQAQGHLLGAGIRIADYRSGKTTVKQAENYLLDLDDITQILSVLTERDREIADALQKYMNTVGSDWGNEVSMKRFGIQSFTEENYFPIKTDDRTRPVRNPESDTANLYRLLNMSFTKNVTRGASNSVVLDNIFDVFANHMADMAKYNGLGLPMLDAMKWFSYNQTSDLNEAGQYGYESVQKSVERAFGKEARNYFTTFMQDLNGVREGGRGEAFGSRMLSHYKVAAVGANLRVALLQPTSYLRAGAVLDKKYLAKGLGMSNRQGREEAAKHSGTAVWKDLGFYDTNINAGLREMIKHTDGPMEQVQEVSMKGAELGDKITWGALWNACKAEQADKGLTGDALMEATAKRFREVVYRTQVMDSTMTRSHVMRQKGAYAGMVTAFMSEPTLSYNMLLDAYTGYENEVRKNMQGKDPKDRKAQKAAREEAWEKSRDAVGKAAAAYTATAVLSAVVESLIDAARDDDEYANFLERFAEKLLGFNPKDPDNSLWENIKELPNGNLLEDLLVHNKLPVIKDFFSMLSGQNSSRLDTEWMASIIKALGIAYESLALRIGWQEEPTKITYNGNMTGWGKLYNILRGASQVSGLPLANALRDAMAFWNSTAGELTGKKLQTYDPGPEKKIKYAVQDGYLTEDEAVELLVQQELAEDENDARQKAYVWANPQKYARMLAAMDAGDREEFEAAKAELEDLRFRQSEIGQAIADEIEKQYLAEEDPISRDEAVRRLMEYGGMIERKAEEQVQKWSCQLETGITYSGIADAYEAGDITREQAEDMLVTYGGYAEEKAEAQVQKWSSGKETGIQYSDIGDMFFYGDITEAEAVDMYMKYGGKSQEDAEDAVQKIAFRRDTGHERERADLQDMYIRGEYSRDDMKRMMLDYGYSKTEESAENSLTRWDFIGEDMSLDDVTPWQAKRYFDELEDGDIDKTVYMDFVRQAEEIKADYDEDGKAIAYSKMKKVMSLIDSLDLTDEQKDALARAGWDSSNDGYSDKNIEKYAPWRSGESTDTKKKSSGKKGGGGGGRRGGGGGGRRGGGSGGGLVLGAAFEPPAEGRSGMFEQILKMWKRRKYTRAMILAMVRTGKLTQEEADEILATKQEIDEAAVRAETPEETDGSLTLGAAEDLEESA